MDSMDSNPRHIANNKFGDNVTINQNNIQNLAADQADQCLKDLRLTDPRDDKARIQQTKGGLLKESSNWIFENETFKQWRNDKQNTLLWIKGDPGKGKTMLLCAIIDELTPGTKLAKPIDETANNLLSYFFCQGTDSRINNATAVLRGLIYLIIIQEPSLVSHVQERYSHAGKDLFRDANAWVALSDMLQNILHDQKVRDIMLVVDALDECETDSLRLMDFITQHTSLSHVKWILSSRNILSIQQRLQRYTAQGILSLELKGNAETVSNAVDIYIEHKISRLHFMQHNWRLNVELREVLRQKADGTFLWVSLVMKELEDVQSWEVMEVVKEIPMDLTAVYRRMINQIRQQRQGNANFCWKIISTIFTAYYPLSLGELGVLSGLPKDISAHLESIIKLITLCGSFLTIREGIVYFIHQSAKDFLSTEVFQSDAARRHADIYEQSTTAISTLPQNIYGLWDFGSTYTSTPEPNPLASMRYACSCWTDHFCDAYGANPQPKAELSLKEKLWSFLKQSVLRWLESMILLDRLLDGLRSIQKMIREVQFDTGSQLSKFLHSTEKFIINNGPVITRAPLQLYGSALVFSQTSSDIHQQQWKERLPFIEDIKGVIETNNALLQTLEGNYSTVRAVCFSLDGKAIASCCRSGTVQIWDAATGATQHTLTEARGRNILAISFSPDGESFVFVSSRNDIVDKQLSLITVSLNPSTPSPEFRRGCVVDEPIEIRFHFEDLRLDGEIATELDHRCIQLNGTIACEPSPMLDEIQLHSVRATFSPDGKMLATIEGLDGPIELWNIATIERLDGRKLWWDTPTCWLLRAFQQKGTGDAVICIMAFSPDSKTIASGHRDATVNLWDVETGSCFRTFTASHPHPPITAVAFQLDGKKLVLGDMGASEHIRVLDITTGREQETHISHDDMIFAIAFSPDGKTIAVGLEDGTTRLWDADLGMRLWTAEDAAILGPRPTRSKMIDNMVFSPDGKILALNTFQTREVELWDTSEGTLQSTIDVSPWIYNPTIASNGSSAITFSPDGGTLAFGCCGICLCDMATGRQIPHPTLSGTHCTAIAFSPNGGELASSLGGFEIQLQNMARGEVERRFSKEVDEVHAITFLPEGKTFAAVYHTGLILVWDAVTGACLQEFHHEDWMVDEGLIPRVRYTSIKYSPEGPFLCLDHRYLIHLAREDEDFPEHDLLLIEEEWITKGEEPRLWLPREYRSNDVAIQGNMVAIGHKSGLTFLRLNFPAPREI